MKQFLTAAILTMAMASSAMAVPSLQLYIDGGSYDDLTQTWVTNSNSFDLWVVAANLDHKNNGTIYDIGLVAALGKDTDPNSGSLSITPEGGAATNYIGADFNWGTPPAADPLPGHGIYPTNFVDFSVAASTPTDDSMWEEVQDYVPGGGGGTDDAGFIYKYSISTTYEAVHFDAYGFYDDGFGRRMFAPFSHDAEFGPNPVPEPTSVALLTLGLVGMGVARRFKKK
jgi:hypothetical protein